MFADGNERDVWWEEDDEWIEPEHEVASQKRLLAAPGLGEVERLVEGGQDAIFDLVRERTVSGIGHLEMSGLGAK